MVLDLVIIIRQALNVARMNFFYKYEEKNKNFNKNKNIDDY